MQAQFVPVPPVPKPPSASRRPSRNLLIAIAAAAVVAAALIAGSIFLTNDESSGTDASPVTTATDGTTESPLGLIAGIPQNGTVLGNPGAQVVMLQYEDIQCPFCRQYTKDVLPALITEYVRPGRLKLDFRGMNFLGPDSDKALRIALAAAREDKLWEVVELFYAKQGEENSGWVTDALIDEVLAEIPDLDAAKVKTDAESAEIGREIADIQAEAAERGVQGTPSFYIGIGTNQPYQLQVALSAQAFRPALDDALKG